MKMPPKSDHSENKLNQFLLKELKETSSKLSDFCTKINHIQTINNREYHSKTLKVEEQSKYQTSSVKALFLQKPEI